MSGIHCYWEPDTYCPPVADTIQTQQTLLRQCLRHARFTKYSATDLSCCMLLQITSQACHYRADEGIGVVALRIIYEDGDYMVSLIRAGLDTLESRREHLTERFFKRSVRPETSCLHYLLPDKRDVSITGRLRHATTLEPLKSCTIKFQHSFIPFCLDHYVQPSIQLQLFILLRLQAYIFTPRALRS